MTPEFRMTRTVQFAETDMAGVLHFSNYYRMMEEIEHAFWRSLGLCVVTSDAERQISWPRVAASCQYFAPARFEDRLELVLQLARLGERSVTFEVIFYRGDERLALGKMTAVCCAMTEGKFQAIAIPPHIRARLSSTGAPATH